MKKYTHAWIAFKAIERLEKADLGGKRNVADSLIKWFKNNKDGVINGAWYPDSIIKDNANSHVYKHEPYSEGINDFRCLPSNNLFYINRNKTDLYEKNYKIDVNDNLPNRCEALAHSIVDNLKIQESEEKGSATSVTDNHVALRFFMLSHYIADAHMPFHCDKRSFSSGSNLHGKVESVWEDEIKDTYKIDIHNERFYYDPNGHPLIGNNNTSILQDVEAEMTNRQFIYSWGSNNSNVLDFMTALCQYSYLLSYSFIPQNTDIVTINQSNWNNIVGQTIKFEEMSKITLTEAIESVARIWLRVWARYQIWLE